jgi:hypothetical protein
MPLQIDSVAVPDPDELLGHSVTQGQNVTASGSAAAGGQQEFAQVQRVLPSPIRVSELAPEIGRESNWPGWFSILPPGQSSS